jgi:PBP1b-binding outer membrane lipoprotein LpoB
MMKRLLFVPVWCVLIAGCSDNATDTAVVEPQAETLAPEIKQATVFDAQLNALDKAKSVESTLQDAAEAERKKIEQASD